LELEIRLIFYIFIVLVTTVKRKRATSKNLHVKPLLNRSPPWIQSNIIMQRKNMHQ